MSKTLRLSEKWFRRGLWLVAVVFASFLIGLGGTLVGDLPQVEHKRTLDDVMPAPAAQALRDAIKHAEQAGRDADAALEQARLQYQVAQSDTQAVRESFSNWLATRRATQQAGQDAELITRTQALDQLKATERQAQAAIQAQEQAALDARQQRVKLLADKQVMEDTARAQLTTELRHQELRVFLYRLALTLPLLGVAGWLFVKKRQGTYWPFVWGFIFFAVFAFFVELVPYLPSYGGYVRYIVGIALTVLVGRYAILALNRYLERQKLAEQRPDAQRREELSYDVALARLAKGVCPGCERPVDLKNAQIDFCPHCGIGLFDHCGPCGARKSAFACFCHACGSRAGASANLPA